MEEKIDRLLKKLKKAKEDYYLKGEGLSDSEFDETEEELRKIAPGHQYFEEVGFDDFPDRAEKIRHKIPMLSMGKVKSSEEFQKWFERLALPAGTAFCLQPKIDGLSAACLYRNKKLIYVATRGDGKTGQNITDVSSYIDDIPEEIGTSEETEIRGELYLPKNTAFKTGGKPLRNNCVGLINRKENRADLKYVHFMAYGVFRHNYAPTNSGHFSWLKANNFHVPVRISTATSVPEILDFYRAYLEIYRDEWLYETDGIVVTVDRNNLLEDIDRRWVVTHHHHYVTAFKPPSEGKETRLKKIEWQMSRRGNLVPVAVFDKIQIGGATLTRATLHNYAFVKRLELRKNDLLLIERANDVIPYVKEKIFETAEVKESPEPREEGKKDMFIPELCPFCREESLLTAGVHLSCSNKECPEKNLRKILFWVKQSGMENIAEKTIRRLSEERKIKTISDLYQLKEDDFRDLEGFKEKKIRNFLEQVEKTRLMTAGEFISRLGIPLIQKRSLEKLGVRSMDDFFNFDDPSYTIGRNLIEWKKDPENKKNLEDLLRVIRITEESGGEEIKKTVCITGKGPRKRSDLEKELEKKGFSPVSRVTKETSLLLYNPEEEGSSKLEKARKYGIPVKSYDDFFSEPEADEESQV